MVAQCAHCKAETELFDHGVPVCLKCSDTRGVKRKPPNADQIRTALIDRVAEATARVSEANRKFSETIGQFPSGLPHPDGVQRIHNTSNELTLARKELMTAHKRLSDFVDSGIVPEDLKRFRSA